MNTLSRALPATAAVTTATSVIAFPRERCRASSGKIRLGCCSIVILPVVRIERWPEEPAATRTPRNSKSKRKTP